MIGHLVKRIPTKKINEKKPKLVETGATANLTAEKAEPKAKKWMTAKKAAKMATLTAERRAKREKNTADGIDMYAKRGHQRE